MSWKCEFCGKENDPFKCQFGEAASAGKWAMHIIGPDEIHDMPDELTALREANKLNKRIVKWRTDDPSPHDPFMVALVKNLEVEEA